MKKNVICDNMIWCQESSVSLEQWQSEYRLIGTYSNLYELCTSGKHALDPKNKGLPRKGIRNLMRFSKGQGVKYFLPPILYLEQLMNLEKEFHDPQDTHNEFFGFASAIANGEEVRPEMEQAFTNWVAQEDVAFRIWADLMNDATQGLRELYDTNGKIAEYQAGKSWSQTLYEIAWWVSLIMNPQHLSSIDPKANPELENEMKNRFESFNWEKVELFVKVYDQYRIALIKDKNRKAEPNDFYDLWNLVYVQPEDMYWTKEKFWIRLIKELDMEFYLYQESTPVN